ncbi:MAG: methyltransferase domain-containing protein [Candidatus Riflebacteria bacterium]|nr:methyltransferase domain-containing protein [Candidatus Riflebacteria bacterium]
MTDDDCVRILREWCPRHGLRFEGFRRVRSQVRKRIGRRLVELGLAAVERYLERLEADPAEQLQLESFCRISISRFYRDRLVFDRLREAELPRLAREALESPQPKVRIWCAGCASGEEPYTIALLWSLELADRFPGCTLELSATDANAALIDRAHRGEYPAGSIRDLPAPFRSAFEIVGRTAILPVQFRSLASFSVADVRTVFPDRELDGIFCRNLPFTYFELEAQRRFLEAVDRILRPGGLLAIGAKEVLPGDHRFRESAPGTGLFVRSSE